MTVYAIVSELNCGYDHDKRMAEQAAFQIGDRFTVKDISMGQSHTTIRLDEIEGGFNSVFFSFEEDGEPLNIYSDHRFNPYI